MGRGCRIVTCAWRFGVTKLVRFDSYRLNASETVGYRRRGTDVLAGLFSSYIRYQRDPIVGLYIRLAVSSGTVAPAHRMFASASPNESNYCTSI